MVLHAVTVNVDHNDGSADFQIFQVDVAASNTNTISTSMVYQEGDSMKVQANAASRAMIEVSSIRGKTTTIMYVIADVPKEILEYFRWCY